MQRYFVQQKANNDHFIIDEEDRHHIVKVMRMEINDRIICVDPEGKQAVCRLSEITNSSVVADVVQWIDESPELPISITIASGLPKGDKLEWIIQKGTELGAQQFLPFSAARSVVKWDEKKAAKKIDRWQKIAKEAAEQSHRTILPSIINPMSFKELLKKSNDFDYKLAAYEEESRQGETSVLSSTLKKMKNGETLLFVFGPEGGLAEEEVQQLKDFGFGLCGLGPRILRTETAPLYSLAAISYHFELLR
ncbi:16S rRNA (uracil(1498)-N(3))-methyltransferase [Bacillus sp. AFS076308]|uniref:16S rRNA (uracil(1498)-N(3))-methyltransferase n=1 Tax=unclassified Bacillus (in: firmicutes) TaxID=185979 RepID=UPI000BFAA418|nr:MULTISPECIES: 16S rRNA (uracil(1498)-N(3))-methyltransferase [unclassified Bacillus (in: firmicutes)]PFO03662.1 16S rRNA (uracil(1498)-N(3))-methyltransferase [Bacillus sp. AFS076308]PGV54393.1 16S rRNA (uracil(1498)-N(3))-methyltransferase [Bacillus sp. AFS037270]